jgi:hypothetical protein
VIHLKYCCRAIPSSERCIWLLNGLLPVYNHHSSVFKIKTSRPLRLFICAVRRIIFYSFYFLFFVFTSSLIFEFGLLLLEHLRIRFKFW